MKPKYPTEGSNLFPSKRKRGPGSAQASCPKRTKPEELPEQESSGLPLSERMGKLPLGQRISTDTPADFPMGEPTRVRARSRQRQRTSNTRKPRVNRDRYIINSPPPVLTSLGPRIDMTGPPHPSDSLASPPLSPRPTSPPLPPSPAEAAQSITEAVPLSPTRSAYHEAMQAAFLKSVSASFNEVRLPEQRAAVALVASERPSAPLSSATTQPPAEPVPASCCQEPPTPPPSSSPPSDVEFIASPQPTAQSTAATVTHQPKVLVSTAFTSPSPEDSPLATNQLPSHLEPDSSCAVVQQPSESSEMTPPMITPPPSSGPSSMEPLEDPAAYTPPVAVKATLSLTNSFSSSDSVETASTTSSCSSPSQPASPSSSSALPESPVSYPFRTRAEEQKKRYADTCLPGEETRFHIGSYEYDPEFIFAETETTESHAEDEDEDDLPLTWWRHGASRVRQRCDAESDGSSSGTDDEDELVDDGQGSDMDISDGGPSLDLTLQPDQDTTASARSSPTLSFVFPSRASSEDAASRPASPSLLLPKRELSSSPSVYFPHSTDSDQDHDQLMDDTPATPQMLASGLPSPPHTPGAVAAQDPVAVIRELEQALRAEQLAHRVATAALLAEKQRCRQLQAHVRTLRDENAELSTDLAASVIDAHEWQARAIDVEGDLQRTRPTADPRVRKLQEEIGLRDARIGSLEASTRDLAAERDTERVLVAKLENALSEEHLAGQALAAQLQDSQRNAQASAARAASAENTRDVIAQTLEARTAELAAVNLAAEASRLEANAAASDAAAQKTRADSTMTKSREIEARLRADLHAEQQRRIQAESERDGALRHVTEAEDRADASLTSRKTVEQLLRAEEQLRHQLRIQLNRAEQDLVDSRDHFDREEKIWERRHEDLMETIRECEQDTNDQHTRAEAAAREHTELKLRVEGLKVSLSQAFDSALAAGR
jgi:hypothetical protein